jgi:hypothetical protein
MLHLSGVFVVIEKGLRLPSSLFKDVCSVTDISNIDVNNHIHEYLMSRDERNLTIKNCLDLINLFYLKHAEHKADIDFSYTHSGLSTHNSMLEAYLINIMSVQSYTELDCKTINVIFSTRTFGCGKSFVSVIDISICEKLVCLIVIPGCTRNICIMMLTVMRCNGNHVQPFKLAGAFEAVISLFTSEIEYPRVDNRSILCVVLQVLICFSCNYENIVLLGELGLLSIVDRIDTSLEDETSNSADILLRRLSYSVKNRNQLRALRIL